VYWVQWDSIHLFIGYKALVSKYQQSACSLYCFDVRNFAVVWTEKLFVCNFSWYKGVSNFIYHLSYFSLSFAPFYGLTAPSGPRPHYWHFEIILRQTTLCRTPTGRPLRKDHDHFYVVYWVQWDSIHLAIGYKALVSKYQQSACSLCCFDVRNFTVVWIEKLFVCKFSWYKGVSNFIYHLSCFSLSFAPFYGLTARSGPRPHCWYFEVILRHTTVCRTPLDERSSHRRDLYLTTHNTHNRQTSIHSAGL